MAVDWREVDVFLMLAEIKSKARFLFLCFPSVSRPVLAGNSGQRRTSLPVVSAWLGQSFSVRQCYDEILFVSEVIK